MSKLKSIDFKALAVDHAEKAGLAVMALLAVFALMGTHWMPYEKKPDEITKKVKLAKDEIARRTWPEEEREKFNIPADESVDRAVERIRSPVPAAPYEFVAELSPNPFRKEPVREPDWSTVSDLLADAGRAAIMESQVSTTMEDEDESDDETETPKSSIDLEFKPRTGAGAGAGAGSSSSGSGTSSLLGYDPDSDYNGAEEMYNGADSMYGGDSMYGSGGSMGMGSGMTSQGQRYVAVRGVFPLREQIRKIKDALHVSYGEASQRFEVLDFELQRQTAVPGDDPWTGEWEPVDIEITKEALDAASAFDPDVVQSTITDSVITSPLPALAMGTWRRHASHPKVENYSLSQEEIEREAKVNSELLKTFQKNFKETDAPVKKGGFNDMQHNVGTMRSAVLGSGGGSGSGSYDMDMPASYEDETADMSSMASGMSGMSSGGYGSAYSANSNKSSTQISEEFKKELLGSADADQKRLLEKWIREQVSAAGDLLLFRYLDFDVEPGKTYRYKVRLIVRNPNYNRPLSDVGGFAHIVQGQTRETEWSNPTEPVTMPEDVNYFVDRVTERANSVSATMSVYEWYADIGTLVENSIGVARGKMIQDTPKGTWVVRPASLSFEQEDEILFATKDTVVDMTPRLTLNPSDHPDIKLPTRSVRNDVGASDQVLVVKPDGKLELVDTYEQHSELVRERNRLGKLHAAFEAFKGKKQDKGGSGDPFGMGSEYGGEYEGSSSEMMGDMYGGGASSGGRTRSSLRKSRKDRLRDKRSGSSAGSSSSGSAGMSSGGMSIP